MGILSGGAGSAVTENDDRLSRVVRALEQVTVSVDLEPRPVLAPAWARQ